MSPSRPRTMAWERGTARLLHQGRPVGGAFLIPGRFVITCSHVVAAIAGLPDDQPLPADFPVTLDFPLLPDHPVAEATVHFSVPVAPDNSGDVAVLRLTGPPPTDAVPLRLVEADDLAGHRWRAFGFPRLPGPGGQKDAGIWTRGTIEGREGTGWWQLSCAEQAGFPLAGGFSGAPVWDEEHQGVVGVVVAVEADQRRRTGYALTVESLAREWPQLRPLLLAESPFRELLPFTAQDRAVFHGRDHETSQLLDLLVDQHTPVLPILGASGVGKSSLAGAGLLALVDPGTYVTAQLPHGLRLTAEELLAWALASAGDADTRAADWHDRWTALARQLGDERGLQTALEKTLARHHGRSRLLLVIDQFETLLADAPETALKLDAMIGVLTTRRPDGQRRAQVVVVARIDFLPQIEQLPVLRAAWEATHVVVPPMTSDQLLAAITRPLEGHASVRFSTGLIEQLLHDTPRGAAALPMLEYTLSQLWARQEHGFLTTTAYQELGGVEGALVGNAERTLWSWADDSEHGALERIFIQLVRPAEQLDAGERGPDTRRVADRTQFSEHDWSLIHRLASTRLVVVTRRPTQLDTAELAHQALVESWPRLRGWVERNREFRSWQEQLRRALRAWQEQGRPAELTLDRTRIDEAKGWLDLRGPEISAEEVEFVDASTQVERRRARRRRIVLSGFALLTALVVVAVSLAAVNARNSDRQRDLVAVQQLITESQLQATNDPALSARLAMAAERIHPTAETRAQLLATLVKPMRTALAGHTGQVRSVAFSPDGTTLATGSSDQTVRLWDVQTHRTLRTLTGQSGAVDSVTFSPDGRTLAISSEDQKVRLWDVRSRQLLSTFSDTASPVVFSRDGSTLATGGTRGTVRLWDVRSHLPLATLAVGEDSDVVSAAFSPDGSTLATGGATAGTVQLWDVRTHRQLAVLTGHTLPVNSEAFSPDGATIATGSSDGTAKLWDTRSHRALATLTGHTNTIWSVAFSPDGTTLATGSEDRTVLLWDVHSQLALHRLSGHTGGVSSVAFSPDGNTLATGGEDTTARLWDVAAARPLITIAAGSAATVTAAFSPDGRILATAADSSARLWDARTHRPLGVLTGQGGAVLTLAFSPDGRTLATGSDDHTVWLWNVQTHRAVATLTGHTGLVSHLAFSPDGRTLATGSYVDRTVRLVDVRTHQGLATFSSSLGTAVFSPDGATLATAAGDSEDTVQLWDVATRRALATLVGHTSMVSSMAFSPDGGTLATGSWDHTVRLWDGRSGRALATLTGHSDSVQSVAFSPDGTILASSGRDSTARLWDVRSRRGLIILNGHVGIVWSAVFSPDGRTLATAGDGGMVYLWDVPTRSPLATLTGHTGRVESAVFSPDGRTLATSSDDGTVRLWNTEVFRDLPNLIERVCAVAGRSMTQAEWQEYVPGGVPYRQICP